MKGIKERRRGGGVKDKDTEEIIIGWISMGYSTSIHYITDRLLWIQYVPLGSWPGEWLSASQEGFCSVELTGVSTINASSFMNINNFMCKALSKNKISFSTIYHVTFSEPQHICIGYLKSMSMNW
jgi:hypothetical protein